MVTFVKRALFIWMFFVMIAIVGGGGGQFRSFGEKAGGVSRIVVGFIADKADDLKEDADAIIEKIKEWTGGKKEIAKNSL